LMPYSLPPLPYAPDALEPHIDRQTMELHHSKHHATYISKLNADLEHYPALQSKSVEELLRGISNLPSPLRTAARKMVGVHANPSLFGQIMGPAAGFTPTGAVADAITASFGTFSSFKDRFSKAALDLFGSGWAWVIEHDGHLSIESTPNQDSPLMEG